MSRSYRKRPFSAITGCRSAKDDKVYAHRGERRGHKAALTQAIKNNELDNYLPPHRLECSWNEVYSWGRDGHQFYHKLDADDWMKYLRAHGIVKVTHRGYEDRDDFYLGDERYKCWPPAWYTEMLRK